MVLYSQFYKPVRGLFTENYKQDTVSVKTKTRPNKNLELRFETTRAKGTEFESKLGWTGKFNVSNYNVSVDGEVKQAGEFSERVIVKGLYDGVVVEGNVKLLTNKEENPKLETDAAKEKKKSRDEASLTANYIHKHADLSLKLTKKELNPLLLSPSVAFHFEDFSVGFEAEYEFDGEKKDKKEEEKKDDKTVQRDFFRDYNFGASYNTGNLFIVGTVVNKLSDANLGIVHKLNKNTSLGFEFSHKLAKNAEPFKVQVGVSSVLDEQSNIKAKLLSSGLLSVAYQVKVKPELTATLSLETSAKEISDGKIGVELSFEPLD